MHAIPAKRSGPVGRRWSSWRRGGARPAPLPEPAPGGIPSSVPLEAARSSGTDNRRRALCELRRRSPKRSCRCRSQRLRGSLGRWRRRRRWRWPSSWRCTCRSSGHWSRRRPRWARWRRCRILGCRVRRRRRRSRSRRRRRRSGCWAGQPPVGSWRSRSPRPLTRGAQATFAAAAAAAAGAADRHLGVDRGVGA